MTTPLSIELIMRSIDPRADKDEVLLIVGRALDNCDPSERPSLQLTRWPTGYGERAGR